MQEKLEKLKELIILFNDNIEHYKKSQYDEANVRVDFIDKFFELLDWDVRNKQGYSENYREVVREDKVRIEGKPKAPDYSFRIGGTRKFFVEAKKPSINIKDDIASAYQLRRYGYTAKLPLSILTDFEEFAIYDARIKPNKHDKASVARIFYCTYDEYEKHFDFIYNIISKTAILKGSFDRYIEDKKRQKGTSEVDKEFLKLIEEWRNDLARNIALRNKKLNIHNLNYSVQKIIDRIIFLRIAEDRQMEDYNSLSSITDNDNIYKTLIKTFIKADNKYNSSLFKREDFLENLIIDDKILKVMIKGLYYPDCPYEFSVLGVEILGNIYEQFLGKTIRLTPSHQAKVEEKPEVRKAGGVYYTPQYIVDYIVQNTIGEKIKNKKPIEIEKIKILDPACGSGSFLLGAYSFLLKYHFDYYTNKKNIKRALKTDKIYQISENNYKLTIIEKQNILLNNIFGVDIDRQATEVTKLSLLLKLLEDESQESAGTLFKHTDLKLLPDLSDNIKCGNSLIGTDFYETQELSLFDDDNIRKINAFDWDKEFPEIIKNGGFDMVIGNPPYVKYENLDDNLKLYAKTNYNCAKSFFDIFQVFMEKAFIILKESGIIGFIIPNLFLKGMNYIFSRKFFYENSSIKIIKNYSDGVFKKVKMPTCVIIFSKEKIKNNKTLFYIKKNNNFIKYEIKQWNFKNDSYIYNIENISEQIKQNNIKLRELVNITRGLEIGRKVASSQTIDSVEIIFGGDISRYIIKNKHYIEKKI